MIDYLYNGRMLLVDLEARKVEEETLPPDFLSEYLGGARANLEFFRLYPEANLILGCGPITATPAPGACLGIASCRREENVFHTPLNLFFGAEFKLSGFDFVIIRGRSEDPCYLWLHDGIADLSPAAHLPADTWKATDALRNELGEDMVQVLLSGTGPCLNLGYWSSTDRIGLGSDLSEWGLRAICCRGLGILDAMDPEGYITTCTTLLAEVVESLPQDKHGFAGVLSLLSGKDFDYHSPLVHRYRACFACPYNCNTFIKIDEDPAELRSSDVEEPGLLVTDALSLALLEEGKVPLKEGMQLLRRASRLGAFPDGAASLGAGASDETIISARAAAWRDKPGSSSFSTWAPPEVLYAGEDEWHERQSLAYTLGICPILMQLSPALAPDSLCQLLKEGMGLEIAQLDLVRIAEDATKPL